MVLKRNKSSFGCRKLDDDDDLPEALDTGRFPVSVTTRRILNFMKLLGQYLQLVRGPTWLSPSSVEADITGGSNMSSQVQPKQEASTASSKNYTFKKGDRVKYVGSLPSGFSPTQTPIRGPTYGYRGKVVLAFEENGSSKIGVRFDRAIPEGNDLGGLCEEDRGFFCADIEKCLVGNPGAYAAFKITLETLPENVTQTDSRKEKSHPGGLLFTKFGSNQTALLDLAFPDNFGRLHDRSKETPKTMKQLSRLFPNKVTIQIPQDEAVLVDRKQKLDRDTETLKSQSNIGSIRSVLKRLLAGVYAITLCIPPELHPRSGNTLFEVKVDLLCALVVPTVMTLKPSPLMDCLRKLDDDDDLPEALDTGRFPVSVTTRRILNFMKLVGQYLQLVRGPTWLSPSSVEADITGGSNMSSQVQPKQEASTASSKNCTFKKGDRVKYVGSLPSGFSPTQTPIRSGFDVSALCSLTMLFSLLNVWSSTKLLRTSGVQHMVTEARWYLLLRKMALLKLGLDLIEQYQKVMILGACVKKIVVSFVQLTYSALIVPADDIEKLAINELFEVASEESKSAPLILFLKDIEKCLVGNPGSYAAFKITLETLPENVTQTDSRNEKSHPGGLLFTKFGSNQTALLDLAFP
ncbi:UNVERIFIED_CONTAM: hypothetical protein Sradi_7167600, partial [Sesamum radiatum]